jgi:hypothetical protein
LDGKLKNKNKKFQESNELSSEKRHVSVEGGEERFLLARTREEQVEVSPRAHLFL